MHSKLAGGHLPLQDMIKGHIESAREKLAAAKPSAAGKSKTAAPVEVQTVGSDDGIEKLASALIHVGTKLASSSVDLGGESKQGGEVLPVQGAIGGKQNYSRGQATKKHQVPTHTGMQSKAENGSASTATPDTQHQPPVPLSATYPKKGVLKTAAESVKERIFAAKGKKDGESEEKKEEAKKGEEAKEKEGAAATEFILGKMAEAHGGGMTLDSKSGEGPKPPSGGSNSMRSAIESNSAATSLKKRDAKSPGRKQLSEVLTEPAQTKSTDPVVQNNLRNANKGGVKIAASLSMLQKIAADPNDPRHEALQKAIEKQKKEKSEKKDGKKEKDAIGTPSMMGPGSGSAPMM